MRITNAVLICDVWKGSYALVADFVTETLRRAPLLMVGGSGRVGQMLIAHFENMTPRPNVVLQTRGRVLSSHFPSLLWDPRVSFDPLHVWQAENQPIAAMIVLAGVTPAGGADLTRNVDIGLAVVEACLAAGIPRCLLASSSAVYGPGEHLNENSPLRPLNQYGRAKRDMERQVKDLATSDLNSCCLRIGNVAGADAIILNALKATAENPLTIDQFSDGRGPIRSYIGPHHLAEVLLDLATIPGPLPRTLNIAARKPIDMIDLARAYTCGKMNLRPAEPYAVQNVTLDCTQLFDLISLPENAASPKELVRQCLSPRRS